MFGKWCSVFGHFVMELLCSVFLFVSARRHVVLFGVWGFLREALVEVPRAWILLRGRGVLGTGPGSPGNPCFPTHSYGSCGSDLVSEELSFSAGDIYSGERSWEQFTMRARSV